MAKLPDRVVVVAWCCVAAMVVRVNPEPYAFEAFNEAFNGVSPASPCIAVGPDHIVAVSNNGIRFFTKDGKLTYNNTFSGTNGFFPGGGTPFHPQVVFDPHVDRFIVAGYYTFAFDDLITVAISDDANPNGAWNLHTIDVNSANGVPLFHGGRITLGFDASTIYVHNDFIFGGNPSDEFSHGFIFSLDKLALMAGDAPAVVAVEPFEFPTSLTPARTYDADAPAQYFVTPYGTFAGQNEIRLFAMRNALTHPHLTTIELTVPPYDFVTGSDFMPHPGGGTTLNGDDSRMRRAIYRNGSLWTAHHIIDPPTGRHIARWYKIDMNNWPLAGQMPELVQAGKIDLGSNVHTFLPDIVPDDCGNAVIGFHHTSATSPPAFARALRTAGDPPGLTHSVETLAVTQVTLSNFSVYAAYAAADVDPANLTLGWVGGAYWIPNQFGGKQPAMWVNSVLFPSVLVGDFDQSGMVDLNDYSLFYNCFAGPDEPPAEICSFNVDADLTSDGDVDAQDFALFQNNFNPD